MRVVDTAEQDEVRAAAIRTEAEAETSAFLEAIAVLAPATTASPVSVSAQVDATSAAAAPE